MSLIQINSLLTHAMAGFFTSASAFMTLLLTTFKTLSDYYPGRLHKAFIIDPPSFFSYLWKGVRPFMDLATTTFLVSSVDFSTDDRFDSTSSKVGACSSSRFAFTVSTNYDTLKPWYLTLSANNNNGFIESSPSSSSFGPALISPLNARSFSFASPTARGGGGGFNTYSYAKPVRTNVFCPSTPLPPKSQSMCGDPVMQPRTPKASFLHSPALFFRKERTATGTAATNTMSRSDKSKEAFLPYLKFYSRPYDEMIYRARMRPPLGGLISIIPPHLKRRHASLSQRY